MSVVARTRARYLKGSRRMRTWRRSTTANAFTSLSPCSENTKDVTAPFKRMAAHRPNWNVPRPKLRLLHDLHATAICAWTAGVVF